MEHDFPTANLGSSGRLLKAFAVTILLASQGAVVWAADASSPHASFSALDSEVQAIKAEILAINQEILLLEESFLFRPGEQLVVLVSVARDSGLNPTLVSLELDGDLLTRHNYSSGETAALTAGGVHRLYTGLLSEGEHRIDVYLSGTRSGNKTFEQQHSATISKTQGRSYLELQLGPGKKKHQAELTIRQWQP